MLAELLYAQMFMIPQGVAATDVFEQCNPQWQQTWTPKPGAMRLFMEPDPDRPGRLIATFLPGNSQVFQFECQDKITYKLPDPENHPNAVPYAIKGFIAKPTRRADGTPLTLEELNNSKIEYCVTARFVIGPDDYSAATDPNCVKEK